MRREGRGLTGEMEMNSKHTHSEESQGSVRGCRWTREPAKTYGPCSHRGLESTPVDLAGPFMVTSRNVGERGYCPRCLLESVFGFLDHVSDGCVTVASLSPGKPNVHPAPVLWDCHHPTLSDPWGAYRFPGAALAVALSPALGSHVSILPRRSQHPTWLCDGHP
ncbi:uncharacterized protein LOC113225334 isoform X2 [Piliocolobus tephrosceles]|uniref:uncharacterized protein LOC113225334 isoform X2 n=1 Tax=Piliocolobus tephrosceles TaxID=591936 RepID=UPI000E6B0D33|nr:uncharacterized protein LOC113225334 isoform X2 [Piliocolobus tephrosceles]